MSIVASEVEWLVARVREKLGGLSMEVESFFTSAVDKIKTEDAAKASVVKSEVEHLESLGYTVTAPAPIVAPAPLVDQPTAA